MADRESHVGVTPVNNPLLSAAGNSFPFENFATTAQLVPISQRSSTLPLSEDVGEVDSFLGQDTLPSLPLPGVLPPALKTPSAEQLQPITFYNALGQPTGGGGIDFLAPAGANNTCSDQLNQTRHKPLKRHPHVPSSLSGNPKPSPLKSITQSTPLILPIPSTAPITSQSSTSSTPQTTPPISQSSSQSFISLLFQEPLAISKLSFLSPKSQSTPSSPKTPQASLPVIPQSSKSQPSTVQPSPVHASQLTVTSQKSQHPLVSASENQAPPISLESNQLISFSVAETLVSNRNTLTTKEQVSAITQSEPKASVGNYSDISDSLFPTKSNDSIQTAELEYSTESVAQADSLHITSKSDSTVTEVQKHLTSSTESVLPTLISQSSGIKSAECISSTVKNQSFSENLVDTCSESNEKVTGNQDSANQSSLNDKVSYPTVVEETSLPRSIDISDNKDSEVTDKQSLVSSKEDLTIQSLKSQSDSHVTQDFHLVSDNQVVSSSEVKNSTYQQTSLKGPSLHSEVAYSTKKETSLIETQLIPAVNIYSHSPPQTSKLPENKAVEDQSDLSLLTNKNLHSPTSQNSKNTQINNFINSATTTLSNTFSSSDCIVSTLIKQVSPLSDLVEDLPSSQLDPNSKVIHQSPPPPKLDNTHTSGHQQTYLSEVNYFSPSTQQGIEKSQQSNNYNPYSLLAHPAKGLPTLQSSPTPVAPFNPYRGHSSHNISDHSFIPSPQSTQKLQFYTPQAPPPQPPLVQFYSPQTPPDKSLSNQFCPSQSSPAQPSSIQFYSPVALPLSHTLPNQLRPSPTPTPPSPSNKFYSPVPLPSHPPTDQFHTTPSSQFQSAYTTQTSVPPPPTSAQPHPLSSAGSKPLTSHLSLNTPRQSLPQVVSKSPLQCPDSFQSTPNTSINRYSIQAKPQLLRRPYQAYSQSLQTSFIPTIPQTQFPFIQTTPLVPPNNFANQQPVSFLVPADTPSVALTSVPLTADSSHISYNDQVPLSNSYPSQFHPTPPLPSLPPSSSTPVHPPFAGEGQQNPFSVRSSPKPPKYIQEQPPINGLLPQLSQPSNQSATLNPSAENRVQPLSNQVNSVLPSIDSPTSTAQISSPSNGLIQPDSNRSFQEYTSEALNSSTPLTSLPPVSSFAHPPTGTQLGASKSYRLGKQKPRYAQVPDLIVSPSTQTSPYSQVSPSNFPVVSPLGVGAAVPDPYTIYPPGSSQFETSSGEEYLVPSRDFESVSDNFQSPFSNLATLPGATSASATSYRPVYSHWFFKKEIETKVLWKPFTVIDSLALEDAYNSSETNEDTVIPTDGGRYDVKILQRQRLAVYWEEKKPTEVQRCSWFYKGPLDSRYTPYDEEFAARLEEEYRIAMESNKWNRKVEHNGDSVVMHGPVVMVHYSQAGTPDQIGVPSDTSPVKPRVVKRGVEEFEFEEGESSKVDHLLFLVHGIGSVCDLKFRDVVETVDDFRSLALQLTRSHFSACVEGGQANRVEVLPVSWHGKLHGEDTGIDRKLQSITLKSIPRLRHFTNDTLLDILFYTSPVYCQTIMDTVGNEMNRMYELFLKRNPDFKGTVSLGGHSLGSLILFDLLYHQKVPKQISPAIVMTEPGSLPPRITTAEGCKPSSEQSKEDEEADDIVDDAALAMAFARSSSHNRRASCVNYMMGPAGTGQPYINYPQLKFKPESFFALGSPIGMFVTVRGIETLGNNFRLPTCPGFFNIFHPFDPVAYRIESLIDPELAPTLRPVLIPHHKGRKRMHLELKETMARVGTDLKNKFVDSVKSTWNTMTQYTLLRRTEQQQPSESTMEQEVTKVLEAHLGPLDPGPSETDSEPGDQDQENVTLGCLNGGRRVDYVLQEAPLESFNEYLFALQSHVCYWESEDTLLLILTEIYRSSNVCPDSSLSGNESARDRSPIKLLSDHFLPSASSPPKPQLFSALRYPSASSLSSEGSVSNQQGVSRSISVPKLTTEPNPTPLSTSSPGYLQTMGFSNQSSTMGVDPTAPMSEIKDLAPPPTGGFVKKTLQRK